MNDPLERLRAFVALHENDEFYACGLVEGSLWLNSVAQYEQLKRKNERWKPEAWRFKRAVVDCLPVSLPDHDVHALALLSKIDSRKAELFPRLATWFRIVFQRGAVSAVGLEKVKKALSPDAATAKAFVLALEGGDLEAAARHLEAMTDVNFLVEVGPWEQPLLQVCIAQPRLVERLIERGAELRDATTWTRSVQVLERLVNAGAPVDPSDRRGERVSDYDSHFTVKPVGVLVKDREFAAAWARAR